MENVPRVKKVLEQELSETGQLAKFAHLKSKMQIEILDASEYGLPQKRKRCIAGNFPSELLATYKEVCPRRSLKQAVSGFNNSQIKDVNYGFYISSNELSITIRNQVLTKKKHGSIRLKNTFVLFTTICTSRPLGRASQNNNRNLFSGV